MDNSVICRNSTTCIAEHNNTVPQVEHFFDEIVQPEAEPDSTNPDNMSADPTPEQ